MEENNIKEESGINDSNVEDYVKENKDLFVKLVEDISEERMSKGQKDRLISWLTNESDFFTAPASTKYHASYKGGLCIHSLNVYFILKRLTDSFIPKLGSGDKESDVGQKPYFDDNTLKIVALFHDISKANYYEKCKKNIKNDKTGQWEQVEEYRVKPTENRFIFGNQEETSEFMISSFVDLTVEERIALLHSQGGMGKDSTQVDMTSIFTKHPLSLLLHSADMIATYITENEEL